MRLKRKNISNLKFSIAVIDYLTKTLRLIQRNILKFQDKPILRTCKKSALQHSLF